MSEQPVTGDGGMEPVAVSSLADDLKALGIRPGDTVMVHTSLRSPGYVIGGAQAVLDALRLAVAGAAPWSCRPSRGSSAIRPS
jgi:aminoglycoside N3'-acetyltransferase